MPEWVTSREEGHQGGEELQSLACSDLGSAGISDFMERGALGREDFMI